MKLTEQSLAVLAMAMSSSVMASPVPEPNFPSPECSSILGPILDGTHLDPLIIPFCSSFLHITTLTKSTTITVGNPSTTIIPTTIGTHTITPVVTSTTTACLDIPTPVITLTGTVTATNIVTSVHSVSATATAAPSTTWATVTSTKTVANCPAPTLCGNQGLQWDYVYNDIGKNPGGDYPAFKPEKYKTVHPIASGVTNTISGIDYPGGTANQSIYGSVPLAPDFFVLNHRGYIYAQKTGTYKFTVSDVDDIVLVWITSFAYSGWTRANADKVVPYATRRGEFTVNLQAGKYYPVRIIFGQSQGAGKFQLTVTAPDGTVFLGPKTPASPYLVQYSCDKTTAPPYAPFGSEK
ncbi:hypothetical protein PT974_12265 [Cladobotryum mycophilum]|uniref:PA14 domain-containing protein n=1 Tax=Cladobotryum mycophilum TaxID=491253 RepID=A0ABR0S8N6_9HYPO